MKMNPRLTRLQSDYKRLIALQSANGSVKIVQTAGNPPEVYYIKLVCKGIGMLDKNERPIFTNEHRLKIFLPQDYPRNAPIFYMQTPIWHPNIGFSLENETLVCIGDTGNHGYAPSMGLDDLVVRIIQMIRYENFGLSSAYNMDAAYWAAINQHMFPIENS